jgi:fibronectin type 3 domain-containing protein
MVMNRKRVHAGMVLWGILLFSSCKTDVLNPAQETSADGKVVLTVQAGLGGRSVLPQFFQTDITGYTLLGGKDSAAEEELVSFTTDGTTVAIETGTWDFTLNAYKGGAVILQGTITGRTITAVSTALAFSLAPLNDGAGSIEITITVPVGTGITQVVVYKDDLLLAAPLPDISLLGTEGKIVYTENAVASGEYRYRFELKDADDVTLGWVSETTLVRRNLTSKATIPLTAADLNEAISAGIVNTSAIGLEWTERTDAAEYRIYRTDNPSGTYTQIAAVPAGTTSYTDAGLSPGTWYYKISSYKNDGTTLHTLYKTVTLSAPAAGVPVPVINTAPATAGSVSLGWTAVSGAAYRIYRSGAVVGPYIQIGESAGTSYPDNGLSAGTTYYYQVSAVQGGDEGARSAAYSVKTLLSAPAEVSATATSAAGMTIAWQAVSGAAGYRVYYSTSAGGPYTSLNTNTAISSPYSVSSGLSAYTPYYYKVCAVDAGGTEGEASAVCTDTTYPAAPANVSAAAEPAGGIKITWTSISGLTYKVYRSASADGAYALVSAAAASPYTNTGLSSSATWYYKVAAVDSAGREGVQSTAASATTNTAVVIQINALQDVALSSSSQTLNKGANESKSFSAGGTFTGTDIQYQWYWDGEPISGATAAAYTVNAGSADRAIGVHQLTVVVTINSEIRSGRCRVTIQN